MDIQEQKEASFPFVIFKVKEELYCVDSRYVEALIQLPKFVKVPQSAPAVTGIFPYRDRFITMFDLRTAFGLQNLSEEYAAFADMLDRRKEDHVRWVSELEQSVRTGQDFLLSHDPHTCEFGKWYDNFKSDNYLINAHLKKIDAPHTQLHHAADEIDDCKRIDDSGERAKRMEKVLKNIKESLMPVIIRLLEETKEVFRSTLFHEMALVLNDSHLSLIVDEVLMVDQLLPCETQESLSSIHHSPYLSGIRRSQKMSDMILELDIPRILREQAGAGSMA